MLERRGILGVLGPAGSTEAVSVGGSTEVAATLGEAVAVGAVANL